AFNFIYKCAAQNKLTKNMSSSNKLDIIDYKKSEVENSDEIFQFGNDEIEIEKNEY
ncbi:16170_t:CDS:1, partial [Dentiscutata heterogama]